MPYKNLNKRKKYHNEYMKKWKEKNKDRWKEIQKKSDSRPERKAYLKKWQKESPKFQITKNKFKENHPNIQKEYDKKYKENNPDKVKAKNKKHYLTTKGIINRLRKIDRQRFGIDNDNLTIELIEMVNSRDKNCVYCGKPFLDLNNFKEIQYDHINSFKPFSKFNIVRCCDSCNQSKSNANVLEWCKFKGYNPNPIILELLSQQSK